MGVPELDWSIERLRQLRDDFAGTESQLRELDRVRAELRDSLLRLSGAIQVLEEMIEASPAFARQPT